MKSFALLCVCVVIILIAGLWPFRFHSPNGVTQVQGDGLAFHSPGVAYTTEPTGTPTTQGFTLEAVLRSDHPVTTHVSDIIYIGDRNKGESLAIQQWRSTLMISAPLRDSNGKVSAAKMGTANALAPRKWVYLALTADDTGIRFYLDGQLQQKSAHHLAINPDGTVVLGNSPDGEQGWDGTISSIGLYPRALTAAEVAQRDEAWRRTSAARKPSETATWFDLSTREAISYEAPSAQKVYVPRTFAPPHPGVLRWDLRWDRSGVSDVLLNIAGFVPFGFLLCWVAGRRIRSNSLAFWMTVLAGIALSAGIELRQVTMPMRDSSSVDLLMNSIGTTIGALACFWRLRFMRVPERSSAKPSQT